MTIETELAKLNASQRKALRAKFGAAVISYLRCEQFLGCVDAVKVGFDSGVFYYVEIGQRGALKSVRCLGAV